VFYKVVFYPNVLRLSLYSTCAMIFFFRAGLNSSFSAPGAACATRLLALRVSASCIVRLSLVCL
jgi:hypothetical protein